MPPTGQASLPRSAAKAPVGAGSGASRRRARQLAQQLLQLRLLRAQPRQRLAAIARFALQAGQHRGAFLALRLQLRDMFLPLRPAAPPAPPRSPAATGPAPAASRPACGSRRSARRARGRSSRSRSACAPRAADRPAPAAAAADHCAAGAAPGAAPRRVPARCARSSDSTLSRAAPSCRCWRSSCLLLRSQFVELAARRVHRQFGLPQVRALPVAGLQARPRGRG